MTKLNQIVAIEKGVKAAADRDLTNAYHSLQKAPLLAGISRTYEPKEDGGDQLPPESTQVILRVDEVLGDIAKTLTRLFDVTLTKETSNTQAKADVRVEGVAIARDVPVTYLLFLEKQLIHMNTVIEKLPTLDVSEQWSFSPAARAWATEPVKTVRNKKVPKNWVKDPGNDKHPAQVEVYHEDVLVGYWTTVKFSGAIPASRVNELSIRVKKLSEAVKFAREEANSMEIEDQKVGEVLFAWLFATE